MVHYLNITGFAYWVSLNYTIGRPINEAKGRRNWCIYTGNVCFAASNTPGGYSYLQSIYVYMLMSFRQSKSQNQKIKEKHCKLQEILKNHTWTNEFGSSFLGHTSGPPPSPLHVSSPCLPPAHNIDLCKWNLSPKRVSRKFCWHTVWSTIGNTTCFIVDEYAPSTKYKTYWNVQCNSCF